MEENGRPPGTPRVNPGYALFQIAKALTTTAEHEDGETRERARQKIAQWSTVLHGLLDGSIAVGSRTPLASVPGWATLEVVTGGFATGELLAGGPLREHELAQLARLSSDPGSSERQVLNRYYLTDDGLAQLEGMLQSGCYDVAVPEEGALLVVAWLVRSGYTAEAWTLLEELGPFLPHLRFYPIPTESPRPISSRVFLRAVGSTINTLKQIKPRPQFRAQSEAIHVWIPLYDQIVALVLETVEGEPPTLHRGPDGTIHRDDGRFLVQGGWPCQHYPEDWFARAQALLERFETERAAHPLCGKPDRRKENMAQLRAYLRRCADDPTALNGRDVGRIRLLLACYVTKYGTPGASHHKEFRARQLAAASQPTVAEIAKVVMQRLAVYPMEEGIADLDAVAQPITAPEAQAWQIPAGRPIPKALRRKVALSLLEDVEGLVARAVITSGETLARVLPQITSEIRAAGFTDAVTRRLDAAIYRAFRRRRSLLLLNLESQFKLEELPWVAALDRHRPDDLATQDLAKQALKEVASLSFVSFPQTIVPNKLLRELRALARGADLDLPLVDEVAADIFMGEFSSKFLQAAKQAADLLQGTLYETYYGIDYKQVKRMPEANRKGLRRIPRTRDAFAALCSSRAAIASEVRLDPARNGMVIEQQQILTTQNLAVLFAGLDLKSALGAQLEEMARRCFLWICRRQQMKCDGWHGRLIMLKNMAYAWRQMIFFLALLSDTQVQAFLSWATQYLDQQKNDFAVRFRPALQGLILAAAGRSPDDPSAGPLGAKRFLGWSKTRHWLLAD